MRLLKLVMMLEGALDGSNVQAPAQWRGLVWRGLADP